MDFERTRQAAIPLNNPINNKSKYIPGINLDNKILDLICKMITTDSQYIKRTQLVNIQNFLNSVDPKQYENDPEKMAYVSFIRKGLEGRLQFNLTDPEIIVRHINGGMLDDGIVDVNNFKGLNQSEINWICNTVSETLKYDYVYSNVDRMIDICTRFKTGEYGSKSSIVKEFEDAINNVQNDFRRSRHEDFNETMFSLKEDMFNDSVTDTYNQLASPRRKLRTGMQGLNELLGGGFESGRLYVFFGLPGEGKSTTLLNLMYQVKRYNLDYKTKDPTKTPCVVLLTMENTVVETIERLFGLACIKNVNMTEYSLQDVLRMLRNEGELRLDTGSPIDMIIKYKPTNSVDTNYLYTLVEDLEDQGMECIALFQDYIGRIRSTERYADTRLEYGLVTDEFKVFAENKDIPVITASQLNRDASKHVDEGRKSNKSDLVRFIGRSNISESMLILNNIDAGYMLTPEITQDGEKYLGIQRIKIRYKASDREYIYLPFLGNTIRLIEDFGTEPMFKTTLRPEAESLARSQDGRLRTSQYHTNGIASLDDDDAERAELSNSFIGTHFISSESKEAAIQKNRLLEIKNDSIIALWHPIIFEENNQKLWRPVIFDNVS